MFTGIDLCSDTATRPSMAMKQAMMEAELGDEQLGEDPSTNRLEERMAHMLGKTAAMFFPSATMCNQIAIYLHCRPGDEVMGAVQSHLFTSEGGGAACHARAQTCMIPSSDGTFSGSDVKLMLRLMNKAHVPQSRLVVVENTMNGGGGTVWPLDKLAEVVHTSKEFGLKTHLDGARLFNAAAASKVDVASLAKNFDTITVCFSKGLGCSTGAILAFDQQDWSTIRRLKQLFGGAMRQSGMLAAACSYALDHHVDQLITDHAHAQRLAHLLSGIDGIVVENRHPPSNMIFFSVDETLVSADAFLASAIKSGVRYSRFAPNRFRAVTHRDIDSTQIERAAQITAHIIGEHRR